MQQSASRSGFTLVELSVVMVIVALVAAGILVGRDMLYAAQIRKVVAETREVKTAVNTFKLKYGQFPGDFNAASELWPADSPVNGNGNGSIECSDGTGTSLDCYNAMHHMQLAKMMPGMFTPITTFTWPGSEDVAAATPVALEQAYASVSYGSTWTSHQFTHHVTVSAIKFPIADVDFLIFLLGSYGTSTPIGILGRHAQAIDAKVDDGLPFSGAVMSRTPPLGGNEQLSCTIPTIAPPWPNAYNINSPYFTCALWMPIAK